MPVKSVFVLSLLLISAVVTLAFSVKPMSITLEPRGLNSSKTFRLENESSNRVAFQVALVSREMDASGVETLLPATNEFMVFPPQGVIDPGLSQSVRLVWTGASAVTNEQAYRLIAEELPVNFSQDKGKAQIKILLRYRGTVYVRPRNAKPALRVTSLTKTATNGVWRLEIRNDGSAHQNLINPALTLTDTEGRKTLLTTNDLVSIEGENVLPHHARVFDVALPADIKEQPYQIQITVDE